MELSVRNYRGIERADISIDRIALVGGHNHQGKSSVCQAAASALSGFAIPFLKAGTQVGEFNTLIPKSSAGALVRNGFADGKVKVTTDYDNNATVITWPKGEHHTEGKPPRASVFATGLVDLMKLDEKKRGAFLADLIKASPSKEDLANDLKDRDPKVSPKVIDAIWEKIDLDGFDATEKAAKEGGAKLKGQWEEITGANYGKTIGGAWAPEDWDPELASSSEEELQGALTHARETLEQLVGEAAVGEAEIESLELKAKQDLPDEAAAQRKHDAAIKARDAAKEALEALPAATSGGLPCPHCEEPIALVKIDQATTELRKVERLSDAELKKRRKAIAAADGILMDAEKEVGVTLVQLQQLQEIIEVIQDAKERLAATNTDANQEQVNAAREAVRKADNNLAMFGAWTKAHAKHRGITKNQHIIDSLSAKGVRKSKLLRALKGFNDRLKELSATAKWSDVLVTEDLEPTLGGRAYILLSDSEQYRVKAALQIVIAELDGSDLVILDGADILDRKGRDGMFRMLIKGDQKALVGMTLARPDMMPPLEAKDLGRTYWINDGLCQSSTELAEAAE